MFSKTVQPLLDMVIRERKAQKMSQEQLAELAGISRRSIGAIEAGGDCTLSTLGRLYDALGIEAAARRQIKPTLDDAREDNARAFAQARHGQAFG